MGQSTYQSRAGQPAGEKAANIQPQENAKPRLMDQVRNVLRILYYSENTEEAYTDWILRYIKFHQKRHPAEMGEKEVTDFLTHLANKPEVFTPDEARAILSHMSGVTGLMASLLYVSVR